MRRWASQRSGLRRITEVVRTDGNWHSPHDFSRGIAMRYIAALLALIAFAAAPLAAQPAEAPVVTEARAFMASYAQALQQGDRTGIAARYDRTGAWHLGNGGKSFESYARIQALYAGADWQPPHRFEWRDLS